MGVFEKRAFERFNCDGRIAVKTENGSARSFEALLENISFGGLRMFANEKCAMDSVIELELSAPALAGPLWAKAKIRYVLDLSQQRSFFTMGMEFLETNKDLVLYLIKRQQLKNKHLETRKKTRHLDFIPY